MGEARRPEAYSLEFIAALVRLHESASTFHTRYEETFDDVDETGRKADHNVAREVRERMAAEAAADIFRQFEAIKTKGFPQKELLRNAARVYLPSKANLPNSDNEIPRDKLGHYKVVQARIEIVHQEFAEYLDGFEQTFVELSEGELLDQFTFENAIDASDTFFSALYGLTDDFPPLFSPRDMGFIAEVNAQSKNSGIDPLGH